jgi:hypothetical protein
MKNIVTNTTVGMTWFGYIAQPYRGGGGGGIRADY